MRKKIDWRSVMETTYLAHKAIILESLDPNCVAVVTDHGWVRVDPADGWLQHYGVDEQIERLQLLRDKARAHFGEDWGT